MDILEVDYAWRISFIFEKIKKAATTNLLFAMIFSPLRKSRTYFLCSDIPQIEIGG